MKQLAYKLQPTSIGTLVLIIFFNNLGGGSPWILPGFRVALCCSLAIQSVNYIQDCTKQLTLGWFIARYVVVSKPSISQFLVAHSFSRVLKLVCKITLLNRLLHLTSQFTNTWIAPHCCLLQLLQKKIYIKTYNNGQSSKYSTIFIIR